MKSSEYISTALLILLLSIGLLWALDGQEKTTELTISAEFSATSTAATGTLGSFALYNAATDRWQRAPASVQVSTSERARANTTIPAASYSRLRFAIPAPEITPNSTSAVAPATTVELPIQLDLTTRQTAQVELTIPLGDSLFPSTDERLVFLPQIRYRSFLLADGKNRLDESASFQMRLDGSMTPLFSYPEDIVFSIASDGSIEQADTPSASSTATSSPEAAAGN